MNITEIKPILAGIVSAMGEKGLDRPDAQLWIKANAELTLWCEWKGNDGYQSFRGESVAAVVTAANTWVASLPSQEETHRYEFLHLVASAADYGREHGIDAEFVNPLAEAMKRLSDNALTDQREEQVGEPEPWEPSDGDAEF